MLCLREGRHWDVALPGVSWSWGQTSEFTSTFLCIPFAYHPTSSPFEHSTSEQLSCLSAPPYLFSGRSCALWLSGSIVVSRRGENQRKKGQGYLCYWFRVMPPVMPHTPGTDCLNVASALLSDGLLAQLLRRRLVEIMWQVETRRVCWDFKWEVPFPHCQWWWHSSEKGGWGWHPGTHLKF